MKTDDEKYNLMVHYVASLSANGSIGSDVACEVLYDKPKCIKLYDNLFGENDEQCDIVSRQD